MRVRVHPTRARTQRTSVVYPSACVVARCQIDAVCHCSKPQSARLYRDDPNTRTLSSSHYGYVLSAGVLFSRLREQPGNRWCGGALVAARAGGRPVSETGRGGEGELGWLASRGRVGRGGGRERDRWLTITTTTTTKVSLHNGVLVLVDGKTDG